MRESRVIARLMPDPTPLPQMRNTGASVTEGLGVLANAGSRIAEQELELQAVQSVRAREREMRAATVEAMEALGKARIDSDREADFAGLSDRFDYRSSEIAAQISERFADRPEMLDAFNGRFQEMASRHRVGVYGRELDMRRDTDRAGLGADLDRLLNVYGTAPDAETRSAVIDEASALLDGAREAGLIDSPELDRLLTDFADSVAQGDIALAIRTNPSAFLEDLESGKFDLTPQERQTWIARAERAIDEGRSEETQTLQATAIEMVDTDPGAFLEMVGAGAFDGLSPVERARYSKAARTEVERNERAAAAEEKERQRARDADLKSRVKVAAQAVNAGLPVAGVAELIRDTDGTDHAEALSGVLLIQEQTEQFRQMSYAERQQYVVALRKRAVATSGDLDLVDQIEGVAEAMRKSEMADVYAHRQRYGLTPAQPVDLGSVESLQRRLALADDLAEYHGRDRQFFSENEVKSLVAQMSDGDGDLDDVVAIVTSIGTGLGADAWSVFRELGLESRVYGHAGSILMATGDDRVARQVIAGQRAIEAGEGRKPTVAIEQNALQSMAFNQALPPEAEQLRAVIFDAARAHYASAMLGSDITNDDQDAKEQAFAASVNAVLGGTDSPRGRLGGIQEVNGVATIVMPGMAADHMERVLDTASAEDIEAAAGGAMPVYVDGRAVDPSRESGRLIARYVGGQRYELGVMRNREWRTLMSGDDPTRPAVIDMGVLARRRAL